MRMLTALTFLLIPLAVIAQEADVDAPTEAAQAAEEHSIKAYGVKQAFQAMKAAKARAEELGGERIIVLASLKKKHHPDDMQDALVKAAVQAIDLQLTTKGLDRAIEHEFWGYDCSAVKCVLSGMAIGLRGAE